MTDKQLTVEDLIAALAQYDPKLPVWIAHSDDPENAYHRMQKDDIEQGDIWLVKESEDEYNPKEVPGLIIGGRWFFP
jgi:hypothetical protein